jgi:hypothetical protein
MTAAKRREPCCGRRSTPDEARRVITPANRLPPSTSRLDRPGLRPDEHLAGARCGYPRVLLTTGEVGYLIHADCKAIGVIEAKPDGFPLSGVEPPRSGKHLDGLPGTCHAAAEFVPGECEGEVFDGYFPGGQVGDLPEFVGVVDFRCERTIRLRQSCGMNRKDTYCPKYRPLCSPRACEDLTEGPLPPFPNLPATGIINSPYVLETAQPVSCRYPVTRIRAGALIGLIRR